MDQRAQARVVDELAASLESAASLEHGCLLMSVACRLACRLLVTTATGDLARISEQVSQLLSSVSHGIDQCLLGKPVAGNPSGSLETLLGAVAGSTLSKRQLNKPVLVRICGFLLAGRHRLHGLLYAISRSARLHESVVEALSEPSVQQLSNSRQPAGAVTLLCLVTHALVATANAEPTCSTPHTLLQFLLEVQRKAPKLAAAALASGILPDGLARAVTALRPATAKTALKLGHELTFVILQSLPPWLLDRTSLRQAAALMRQRAVSADVDANGRAQALKALAALAEVRVFGDAPPVQAEEGFAPSTAGAAGGASEFVACTCELLDSIPGVVEIGQKQLLCSLALAIQALANNNPFGVHRLSLTGSTEPAETTQGDATLASAAEWMGAIDARFDLLLDLYAAMATVPEAHPFVLLERASLAPACAAAILCRTVGLPQDNLSRAPLCKLLRAVLVHPDDSAATAIRLLAIGPGRDHRASADALVRGIGFTQPELNAVVPQVLVACSSARSWADKGWACALLAAAVERGTGQALQAVPLSWLQQIIADATASPDPSAHACLEPALRIVTLAMQCGSSGAEDVLPFMQARFVALACAGAARPALKVLFAQSGEAAEAALAQPLARMQVEARTSARTAAALMQTIGLAATLRGAGLRADAKARVARSHPMPVAREGLDEYDYMEHDSLLADAEERESLLLLESLQANQLTRYVPALAACAADEKTPAPVRAEAVGALGRFAHLHPSIAESVLPQLLALSDDEHELAVRSRASLVVASLIGTIPSLVEPHLERVLRSPLKSTATDPALRQAASVALLDLVRERKLKVASELPLILPCALDASLATSAWTTLQAIMKHEGSRWCRLLYSSGLLPLCHTMREPDFAELLSTVVPAALQPVRAEDVTKVGEAMVHTLTKAAQPSKRLRRNLAALIASWPASDRSIGAAFEALGGGEAYGQSAGGASREGVAPSQTAALFQLCTQDRRVKESLAEHVRRARAMSSLKGSTLDDVARLLSGIAQPRADSDSDSAAGDALDDGACSDRDAPVTRPSEQHQSKHRSDGRRQQVERSDAEASEERARRVLQQLQSTQPLYRCMELPPDGSVAKAAKRTPAGPPRRPRR
jgi:hypothetical protein